MNDFYWYAAVLIFLPWALLIFMPSWRFTERVAFGAAFILMAVAIYFTARYLLFGGEEGGTLFTLDGLSNVFRSKEMLLTGWLNYLSFSLFGGAFQVHDAREQRIPHLWLAPSLLLTLLAGPSGLLLYLVIRWMKTRKWETG